MKKQTAVTIIGIVLALVLGVLVFLQRTRTSEKILRRDDLSPQNLVDQDQDLPVVRFNELAFTFDASLHNCTAPEQNDEQLIFPDTNIVIHFYKTPIRKLLGSDKLVENHGIFEVLRQEPVASTSFDRAYEIEYIPTTEFAGRDATSGWLRMYETKRSTYVISYTNGISVCDDQTGFLEILSSVSVPSK